MSDAASASLGAGAWWAADGHVHSTYSDGASTLAANVDAARAAGLGRVVLVDHVRRSTTWLPAFVAATAGLRDDARRAEPSIEVLCGVEVKVLDRSGRLDLPDRLDGLDRVLIADHRYPSPDGPVDPAIVAERIRAGAAEPATVIDGLLDALGEAVRRCPLPAVLAHPLSILPKLGLQEGHVPEEALRRLAQHCRATGAAIEVNEKWACPGAAVARVFHDAGVQLVAGSDAHHASAVGRWRTVHQTLSAILGPPVPRTIPGTVGTAAGAD